MVENPILEEINQLEDKKYRLYRSLDHFIQSDGIHLGLDQPQVLEIRKTEERLNKLWAEERARDRYWLPRTREGKMNQGNYDRPLRRGIHGYGA